MPTFSEKIGTLLGRTSKVTAAAPSPSETPKPPAAPEPPQAISLPPAEQPTQTLSETSEKPIISIEVAQLFSAVEILEQQILLLQKAGIPQQDISKTLNVLKKAATALLEKERSVGEQSALTFIFDALNDIDDELHSQITKSRGNMEEMEKFADASQTIKTAMRQYTNFKLAIGKFFVGLISANDQNISNRIQLLAFSSLNEDFRSPQYLISNSNHVGAQHLIATLTNTTLDALEQATSIDSLKIKRSAIIETKKPGLILRIYARSNNKFDIALDIQKTGSTTPESLQKLKEATVRDAITYYQQQKTQTQS